MKNTAGTPDGRAEQFARTLGGGSGMVFYQDGSQGTDRGRNGGHVAGVHPRAVVTQWTDRARRAVESPCSVALPAFVGVTKFRAI